MKLQTLITTLLLAGFSSFAQAQQPANLPPLVNVSGTGEVKVEPDEIMLNLAVDVRDKSLEQARKQNDQKVASILNYLKKYGVEPKHVQTAYMTVQPIYNHSSFSQAAPDFYTTQKTISVLVKKVDKFDELLTGIYQAGANRIDGIEFRTSELKKHREQARKLAIQAAKEKAVQLTSELGTKAGRVYAITERTAGGNYPMPYRVMNQMAESASMDAASGPTIAGGQITISSTVEASFVIEQ